MNIIQEMLAEHDNILRYTRILTAVCQELLAQGTIDLEDFQTLIAFGREYADTLHHKKEEDILFAALLETQDPLAQKLITHGMFVEHDLGRLYLGQAQDAAQRLAKDFADDDAKLSLLGNTVAYRELLQRHIDKENQVVYPFAEEILSEEILAELGEETQRYEKEYRAKEQQEQLLNVLASFEEKY